MATDVDRDTLLAQLGSIADELTKPGVVELQRDIPHRGTIAWQLVADDAALERDLSEQIVNARESGDRKTWTRALTDLGLLHRRRAARTATAAPVPSLIDQLLDEIPNSTNGESGTGKPGSRSPLAVAALDCAQDIARGVGATLGPRLGRSIRIWAEMAAVLTDDALAEAAARASVWPEQVRAVLDPPRRWTAAGRCPDCGNDAAWVADGSGERVRRPAIEFDCNAGTARCLRCPARWTTEAQLRTLYKYLTDEAEAAS